MLSPTKEKAAGHYADLKKKPFFQGLVDYFSSGPIVAMVWEGQNAIAGGRTLLGATNPKDSLPGTIRGDLCVDIGRNICHGSDSPDAAKHEIEFWFNADEVASVTSHSNAWVYEKGAVVAEKAKADNFAFVFIKPHAVTEKTKALVKSSLEAKGLKILSERSITSEEIDSKKLIDQHYYAIASKATILKPDQLNVPEDKFKAQFGLEWKDALASGKVMNAMDGCKELGIDADGLDKEWAKCKADKKLVKFGGGFYCGLVEIEGKPSLYIFNGFFMSMRSKFTKPGTQIYYYSVEWDPATLSWADFRGQVLGPTDPADAPKDSLRGEVLAKWQELGLASEPNVGDNGMHASASPFEALAERNNWLGVPMEEDPFGAKLRSAGVSLDWIKAGCVDPQVKQDASGKMGSLFDAVEDTDFAECCQKLKELSEL